MPKGYYDKTGLPVRLGKNPWNKNLTKETDERVKINIEKATETIREQYKNGRKGPRLGSKATDETIIKLRISHLGNKHTEEQKRNIGDANRDKKKPPRTEEHKRKIRLNHGPYLSGENHPMFGKRGKETPNWRGGDIEVRCDWCGKIKNIERWQYRKYKEHFCNNVCQHKWVSVNLIREKAPGWKGGISNEPYSFNFNEELKELIRRRDKYKCQLCGMPECENIKKLCIHHIDYNKKNYSPDDLIALCGKCNPKVNFKRDYWRKYFQDKIKKIDLSA